MRPLRGTTCPGAWVVLVVSSSRFMVVVLSHEGIGCSAFHVPVGQDEFCFAQWAFGLCMATGLVEGRLIMALTVGPLVHCFGFAQRARTFGWLPPQRFDAVGWSCFAVLWV